MTSFTDALIFSIIGTSIVMFLFYILLLIQAKKNKLTFKQYLHLEATQSKQKSCKHEKWDMDKQIMVIECIECKKRAWVDNIVDLYEK